MIQKKIGINDIIIFLPKIFFYLIEKGKKIGINEVIKQNEIINNSLKP